MTRKSRINLVVALLAVGIAVNLIVLFNGEESPGWPVAAMIFLGAAALTLMSERREP